MKKQQGQALITLIFFTVIAVTIITAAVSVLFANNLSTSNAEIGQEAYQAAESGVEDGLLKLLRDPAYSGPSYNIGTETTVSITGGVNKTITSTGTAGGTTRKIEVQTEYNIGVTQINSWREIN